MFFSNNSYIIFSILYAVKFITFIVYMRLLTHKLSHLGMKITSISLFLALMFFINTFISFIAFSNVFISKKIGLFIPYIIIEGHILLYSVALLPFLTRSYLFFSFILPVFFGYFLILYNYKNILRMSMAFESKKYDLSEDVQRGVKVSKKLIRFDRY